MNRPLAEMFRYNRWANLALLTDCRKLTGEQLDSHDPAASGSVRELLVHIVGGEQTCVLRTKGRQHEGELNRASAFPGFDALIEIATATGDELIEIAAALIEDRDVNLPYLGKTYRFPLSFFLLHAFEHGAEHRTEVKLSLARLGISTPDLDGWSYAPGAGFGQEI